MSAQSVATSSLMKFQFDFAMSSIRPSSGNWRSRDHAAAASPAKCTNVRVWTKARSCGLKKSGFGHVSAYASTCQ